MGWLGRARSPAHSFRRSQNGDETGTWPNNQFDTEMLQAMILASASGKLRQHMWSRRPGVLGCIPQHRAPRLASNLYVSWSETVLNSRI